ncbi:hypothetical protein [uncultured Methanobrevibacter sp.]|uniref:hypothetical protein n=1 Tax=uncultured Methanobrevibacter sp. TaxID=253161 RepID=UPI0025D3F53D|nr:hypothetical protein [uncultured Methanobrevibacter sp.]
MKTWNEYIKDEREKCLESFEDFRKHITVKTKSDWENIQEIVENVRDVNMEQLLTEKEKFSQVETMDPAYQWMMRYLKYDNAKFTIKIAFTLDELIQHKLLKIETSIKDNKNKYFESLNKTAGECIVSASKKGKKFKLSKENPSYIANNNKYSFYISFEPEKWFFGILANSQEDILQCIKDIFESWSDNVDIELTSFDETLIKWISYKISHFNNTLL